MTDEPETILLSDAAGELGREGSESDLLGSGARRDLQLCVLLRGEPGWEVERWDGRVSPRPPEPSEVNGLYALRVADIVSLLSRGQVAVDVLDLPTVGGAAQSDLDGVELSRSYLVVPALVRIQMDEWNRYRGLARSGRSKRAAPPKTKLNKRHKEQLARRSALLGVVLKLYMDLHEETRTKGEKSFRKGSGTLNYKALLEKVGGLLQGEGFGDRTLRTILKAALEPEGRTPAERLTQLLEDYALGTLEEGVAEFQESDARQAKAVRQEAQRTEN